MIKVITFDAANTLIRLSRPVGVTYATVAKRFGADLNPIDLEHGFRAAWKTVPRLADEPGPRPDDGRTWWREVVIRTLENAGVDVEPFDDFFDAVYQEFTLPGVWRLELGALELLQDLRRAGFRLGIISNFDLRLHQILKHVGVLDLFEQIVVSSQVGAEKPSPRIFEEALRRFAVAPAELLHVGDEEKADGEGARALGIQAFILGFAGSGLRDLRERVGLAASQGISGFGVADPNSCPESEEI
jgi:putative hydrolase of the HAD superfamily